MGKRLRIGYLSGSTVAGGTELYLRELARSLDDGTFEPVILSPPALTRFFAAGCGAAIDHVDLVVWKPGSRIAGGRWAARISPAALSRSPVSGSDVCSALAAAVKLFGTAVNLPRLKIVLARHDLDLIHVHNGGHPGSPVALAAVLAATSLRIPAILTVHGVAKPRGLLRRSEQRLDHRLAKHAAAVTTVGDVPARALAELRGFDHNSIRIVATGIGLPTAASERRAARAFLGLDEDLPVVGSIAAFVPVKGHLALLDSLRHVGLRVNFRAVLAGEGPNRSQVAERIEALGLETTILLPGAVDPFSTLAAFDIFVLNSTTEGLPLSILEAMSQGVPVVATSVGAVPEAVIHGETGYLVAPGDTDGLARRLVELLENPGLARRLGAAGRRRFDAYYRIENMIAAFEGLYHEILGSGPVAAAESPSEG